jgi:DNA invertase Pin-like site-specific DNA recombinase
MITILAGLATFERHLIKARTDEGRPPMPSPASG